jgi:hypothetical protein
MNILNKFNITGRTDESGNFSWANTSTLREYFAQFPNKRFIVKFEAIHPELSYKFETYFKRHILPQVKTAYWQTGVRMNDSEVLEEIKRVCPVMQENGTYKEIKELSSVEMRELINNLAQHLAENLEYILID